MAENKQKVSPVNGVPVPRGRKFTSETAREANRKSVENRAARKSITAAFLKYMVEVIATEPDGTEITGAQAIAKSIIKGATKGSAEMVKIALALTGETPSAKITVETGQLADLIDGLKEPVTHDLHAEAKGVDGTVEDGQSKAD